MSDTETDFEKDKRIIRRRKGAGVNAYGLYVTAIVADASTLKLEREERFFLADTILCVYSRTRGFKRAAWNVIKHDNHDEARKSLLMKLAELPAGRTVMPVAPFVMEMAGTDIESLRLGEAPAIRFQGTTTTERVMGDSIDDDTWTFPEPKAK